MQPLLRSAAALNARIVEGALVRAAHSHSLAPPHAARCPAATLTQNGRNLPFALPLDVTPLEGGFKASTRSRAVCRSGDSRTCRQRQPCSSAHCCADSRPPPLPADRVAARRRRRRGAVGGRPGRHRGGCGRRRRRALCAPLRGPGSAGAGHGGRRGHARGSPQNDAAWPGRHPNHYGGEEAL